MTFSTRPSRGVSDTMAQQYNNNIGLLSGLHNQMIDNAGKGITNAAMAQEAAQQPAINLWNASLGLNGAGSSALAAAAGKGTQSSTQSQSGGPGLFGTLLGGFASNAGLFCFTAGTKIAMANGTFKNIENVEIGDEVASYNETTGGMVIETVLSTIESPLSERTYRVITSDSSTCASTTQPLLTKKNEYVTVGDLYVGEELIGVGVITGIDWGGNNIVYDLSISGVNNYIANGFIAKGGDGTWL